MGFDSSIGIRGEEADQAVQNRGVTGGWAGGQLPTQILAEQLCGGGRGRGAVLLLAHPVLGSHSRPCRMFLDIKSVKVERF